MNNSTVRCIDSLNIWQLWSATYESRAEDFPASTSHGPVERLHAMLNSHDLDGPSALLVPPKNIIDDSAKFLVSSCDTVIDWGASTVNGYAFYDLIRIASTGRISQRRLKREILYHCQLLDCSPEDARSYLAAALGDIGLRNDHFPEDEYVLLVQSNMHALQSALN